MTLELSKQRNDGITYITGNSISRHWELFLQNRSGAFFSNTVASMFLKLKRNL